MTHCANSAEKEKTKSCQFIQLQVFPVLNTMYFWIYGRGERREEGQGEVVVVLGKMGKADLQGEELHHRSL